MTDPVRQPMHRRIQHVVAAQNPFAPSTRCASLAGEEFTMKATSCLFVVLAATLFVGCNEEKPAAKPSADPSKPAAAAPSANAAPAGAPAKPAEKKDEGGW